MTGPIARIIARYAVGALIMKGILDTQVGGQLATDADLVGLIQIALGAAIGAATEVFYYIASKLGWKK